jgi:hypothetical protein
MDRMTGKEREAAVAIIMAETDAFPSKAAARRWLKAVEDMAIELHALYDSACSTNLGPAGNATRASRTGSTERSLKRMFAIAGLGLYLNGDSRGNPVGILTPKTDRFNTMGGREAGWRL